MHFLHRVLFTKPRLHKQVKRACTHPWLESAFLFSEKSKWFWLLKREYSLSESACSTRAEQQNSHQESRVYQPCQHLHTNSSRKLQWQKHITCLQHPLLKDSTASHFTPFDHTHQYWAWFDITSSLTSKNSKRSLLIWITEKRVLFLHSYSWFCIISLQQLLH